MTLFRDATVLLFLFVVGFIGCATPVVKAPAAPVSATDVEEHTYCACVASCDGYEPQLLTEMPEHICKAPPPNCMGLPLYCEKKAMEEPMAPPKHEPSRTHSAPDGLKVYEL